MGLWKDDRGQAIQVGAVLLFGVLIILFGIYQSVIVPNQNRQVEFNHNQRVQGDMVQARNAIMETKTTGANRFASVELGTEFPPRLIAQNPANPSGQLYTSELRPIEIRQGGTDITSTVCPGSDIQTRFLQYSPNYAVFQDAGTIRFENSLVYHDFGEAAFRMTGQSLVRGNTIEIVPLRRAFNIGGSRTVSLEPVAGRVDTSQRDDLSITLPTSLGESAWEAALDGQVDPANITVTTGASGRNLTIEPAGTFTLDCGPVGLGSAPPSGERGRALDEINPAAPGDIKLTDEIRSGNNITLEFNNSAGTNNFTQGRLNFYDTQGGGPTSATINRLGQPTSATMGIREDWETFDPKITLAGDGTVTQVVLSFDDNLNPNDWFILSLELETGETGLYFIPVG